MKTAIRVEGVEDVARQMRRLGSAGRREVQRAVRASLEKVRGDAIRSIQRDPKTGVVYERQSGQNLSSSHQASAPGESPATDTGTLVSSIQITSISPLSGEVGTLLDYGFWLEYGTVNMAARPWLRPALESNRQWIQDTFEQGLERAKREAQR